jgi:hypothetical protein
LAILDRRFVKAGNVVTRQIAHETIIVPVSNQVGDLDAVFTLNKVGSLIWNLIDGQASTSEIVAAVCEAYDVAPEQAEEDTAAFLASLEAAGLIRPCDGSEN